MTALPDGSAPDTIPSIAEILAIHDQPMGGKAAVRALARRVPAASQPLWTVLMLHAVMPRFGNFAEVSAIAAIAMDKTRWPEAAAAFAALRSLVLRLEPTADAATLEYLALAENVAKTTHNATGDDEPFRPDCALKAVILARRLAERSGDKTLMAEISRIVDTRFVQTSSAPPSE